MNKKLTAWILTGFIINGCKQHTDTSSAGTGAAPQQKKNYFPVSDYVKSEIAYVDSFPLKIMKYATSNGKTDSEQINNIQFHKIAQAFLPPGLDSASFENRFQENSFMDRSTGSLTFTYSTQDSSNGLKRVDVLATPDPGTDKVKSIYMESMGKDGEIAVTEKVYWVSRKQFTIIRIYEPLNKPSYSTELRVTWDNGQ
jgi:hypothetical protein